MRKESSSLMLVAMLAAGAIAQEIVIEPTNGRTQSTNHVSRPAAVETANPRAAESRSTAHQAAHPATHPANQERDVASRPAKAPAKQLAARPKAVPVETNPPSAALVAKSEAPEAIPAAKKMPSHPEWAMPDTRDANSLQIEIASALARDPKLAGSAIQVNVDEGAVTLEGRAAGSEERLQAQRLARSYAWNRKVVDHIEVVGSVSARK